MENTSCRLSSNYDSATDDSISLYYSFNSDKTLENSCLDSTVDEIIEETLSTVLKAPPSAIPVKAKNPKNLKLGAKTPSTPTKMLQNRQIKRMKEARRSSNIPSPATIDHNFTEFIPVVVELTETTVEKTIEERQVVIVDTCYNEIKIETADVIDNTKKLVKDSAEEGGRGDIPATNSTDGILADASVKISSEANIMETIMTANDKVIDDEEKFSKDDVDDGEIELKSRSFRNSLADNMVEEIRTILRGTTVSGKQGKENIRSDVVVDKTKSVEEKTTGNGGGAVQKDTIQILKPSRLSVKSRRSVFHGDSHVSTKTVTPIMRIAQNAKKQSPVGSSGIPTPRCETTSTSTSSFKSITDSKSTISQRRSMLPNKRMSMAVESKSSLASIPEAKQQMTKSTTSMKRMSAFMNGGGNQTNIQRANKRLSIAKTTLNSPSLVKKDATRRSIVNKRLTMLTSTTQQPLTAKSSSTTLQQQRSLEKKSSNISAATGKSKSSSNKMQFPREDFVCEVCCRAFRVSSIFEAHKKTHNPAASRQAVVCRFCDRNFAIQKALDKHLLENCLKIPLAERKKVRIAAEQQAEEEANIRTETANTVAMRNRQPTKRTSIFPGVQGPDKSRKSMAAMPPPTVTVVKKSVAHSGLSRTPNKAVTCKPCDKSFDDVISYAEHVLSHSSSSLGEE